MAKTTLNKKMRAFDDEVALTVAPFYLVRMLQRTLPVGFIPPRLPTKTTKLPRSLTRRPDQQSRADSVPGNNVLIEFTASRVANRTDPDILRCQAHSKSARFFSC